MKIEEFRRTLAGKEHENIYTFYQLKDMYIRVKEKYMFSTFVFINILRDSYALKLTKMGVLC